MKPFAKVMYEILGEGAFAVLAKAEALEREGRDILHFEIGQPDFPTPGNVVDAVKGALDENFTRYVPADGIIELKDAVADDMEATRGFRPEREQILILL